MSIHTRAEQSRDIPVAILDAVADCHGIEARDIDRQLADVIDPDSLSHLWSPEDTDDQGAPGEVSFHFYQCHITVRSDGVVTATRTE